LAIVVRHLVQNPFDFPVILSYRLPVSTRLMRQAAMGAGGASTYEKGVCPMSLEELMSKIRWATEQAWLKGNLAALDDIYAADCLWHRPPFPDSVGLEAAKGIIAAMRGAYSDVQMAYEETICQGNSIAYRYAWQVRHTGQSPDLPMAPTGKEAILRGCAVVHVVDGRIVEEFDYADHLGFLQQLGVIPRPRQ
jgi:predicted ester cyclase